MLRDRRVRVCLLVAALLAIGNEWLTPATLVGHATFGDTTYWLARLSWIAPYAVALVAVVSSARAGAAVVVAGTALLASLVAVVLDPGVHFSQLGFLAHLLDVVAMLPADLMARRRRFFDSGAGATAGFACGIGLAAVAFLWAIPRIVHVPGWYLLGGYVFPLVLMTLVGAASGAVRRAALVH
ncbi:MAG: hypothetical protein JOZ82_00620 [Marmoricola sp.]|nr:hypothetical protein [Marmoricola sp.]